MHEDAIGRILRVARRIKMKEPIAGGKLVRSIRLRSFRNVLGRLFRLFFVVSFRRRDRTTSGQHLEELRLRIAYGFAVAGGKRKEPHQRSQTAANRRGRLLLCPGVAAVGSPKRARTSPTVTVSRSASARRTARFRPA